MFLILLRVLITVLMTPYPLGLRIGRIRDTPGG
jgi:hypothetical protein